MKKYGALEEKELATENMLCYLPRSYTLWNRTSDIREPRYLVLDPVKGLSAHLTGTLDIKNIIGSFVREFNR
ncbi:unnamed protein product [Protopolystoma xenopodis]|uniref:Uncharacterized protein n=1 Tax=Protopolystoma xenopodis TaxID=117903 RepID=A0A448XFM0_9PLAT|nr:unnamed protein product [Protopolystoma xenopodis]